MKRNKILVIDGNNQLHRAYHRFKNLTHEKQSVSCIFGTPHIVKALISKFKPYDVYICWDAGKAPERMKLYPQYKEKRKHKLDFDYEDFCKQRDTVKTMFHFLGVKQCIINGYEGDDAIYYLIRRLRKNEKNEIIICSSDKDFKQLIRSNVNVWDVNKEVLFTKRNIRSRIGYTPRQTIDVLCIEGDKSDNIKGYSGIGEKRAKDFISKFGSIKNFLDQPQAVFGKIDKKELKRIYKRNRILVNLALFHKKFIRDKQKLNYFNGTIREFREKDFKRLCAKYAIKSFIKTDFMSAFKKLYYGK